MRRGKGYCGALKWDELNKLLLKVLASNCDWEKGGVRGVQGLGLNTVKWRALMPTPCSLCISTSSLGFITHAQIPFFAASFNFISAWSNQLNVSLSRTALSQSSCGYVLIASVVYWVLS